MPQGLDKHLQNGLGYEALGRDLSVKAVAPQLPLGETFWIVQHPVDIRLGRHEAHTKGPTIPQEAQLTGEAEIVNDDQPAVANTVHLFHEPRGPHVIPEAAADGVPDDLQEVPTGLPVKLRDRLILEASAQVLPKLLFTPVRGEDLARRTTDREGEG